MDLLTDGMQVIRWMIECKDELGCQVVPFTQKRNSSG